MSCSVARINLKKKMRDRKIRTRQEDVRMKQRLDRDLKVLWEEGITDQGLRASLEAGKGHPLSTVFGLSSGFLGQNKRMMRLSHSRKRRMGREEERKRIVHSF